MCPSRTSRLDTAECRRRISNTGLQEPLGVYDSPMDRESCNDKADEHERGLFPIHALANGTSGMSTAARTYQNSFSSISIGEHGTDQLERCGKWLESIPRDDITVLRQTAEFKEFLKAFERLGQAHLRVIVNNQTNLTTETPPTSPTQTHPFATERALEQNATRSDYVIMKNGINGENKPPSELSNVYKPQHHRSHDTPLRNVIIGSDTMSGAAYEQTRDRDYEEPPDFVANETYYQNLRISGTTSPKSNNNNFLRFTDDVLLRIFEFLRCKCLIQTSLTCSRFHQLARKSATQRTYDIVNTRQLGNVMQLLRAREQIHYIDDNQRGNDALDNHASSNDDMVDTPDGRRPRIDSHIDFHVPVPTLLPGRRVLVTNAGDPEFNGVYYCTDCNGNGFVFTKPRFSSHLEASLQVPIQHDLEDMDFDDDGADNNVAPQHDRDVRAIQVPGQQPIMNNDNHHDQFQPEQQQEERARSPNNRRLSGYFDAGSLQSRKPLRCIIAKAYSTHDLLWYMSKEVETLSNSGNGVAKKKKRRTYSYYAPLMLSGSAPVELCTYPSQTSALLRQNHRWRALSGSVGTQPPMLEIIDTNDLDP